MKDIRYIGLFRTFPGGDWQVSFPDLPGCIARGQSFKDTFEAAGEALADHLADLDGPAPRPRSSAELLIDAQRDWQLTRQFVDAVIHPVAPNSGETGRAPADLVAIAARGKADSQIGST